MRVLVALVALTGFATGLLVDDPTRLDAEPAVPPPAEGAPVEILDTLSAPTTSTTTTTTEPPPPPPPETSPRRTPAPPATGDVSAVLARIRQCESGGNYEAVSADGRYRGAYQFAQPTWEAMGGTGDPAQASPDEQDARAAALYAQSGPSPWPTCGYR